MIEGEELVWWQASGDITHHEATARAFEALKGTNLMLEAKEWIFDPTEETINIVFPQRVEAKFGKLLVSAGFSKRIMPTKDIQGAAEMHEALINGGKFN